MKNVYVHFVSDVFSKFGAALTKNFQVVVEISEAEIIIVDNLMGLQNALMKTKEVEIWMPFATADDKFEKEFGFKKLVAIKQANPRIKLYDAFGREGSDGDALNFMELINN